MQMKSQSSENAHTLRTVNFDFLFWENGENFQKSATWVFCRICPIDFIEEIVQKFKVV